MISNATKNEIQVGVCESSDLCSRSFSTIYANSVEPDITRVVNTNRGQGLSMA